MEDILKLTIVIIAYFLPFIYYQAKENQSEEIPQEDYEIKFQADKKVVHKSNKIKENIKTIEKVENPIKQDAVQCLISLGMKKKDATIKVNSMFARKNYQSIESFLIDAYAK